MAKRALFKPIAASLLALLCVGYAWYVYSQQVVGQVPPTAPIQNTTPTQPRTKPATRPSIARNFSTRPTVQHLTMTIDARTGKVTTSTAPAEPEPVDPFRIREPLRHIAGHTDTIRSIALSPDGSKLLTGGNDQTIRLWDFSTGKEIRRFEGHTKFIRSVGFSADAGRIISGGDDSTVRVWDAATGDIMAQLEGHQGSVIAASFLNEPNLAVSASFDGVRLWDVAKEKTIHRFDHDRQICAVAICLPQHLLAVGTHIGHVYLWDLQNRTRIWQMEVAQNCIEELAISADGKKLVVCPAGEPFRIIDALTGAVLFKEDENEHETIWHAAISPDSPLVALARGPQVIFYSLQTFKQYKTSLDPAVFVQSMTFVPNTPLLITAGGGFIDTTDHWTRPHGDMLQIWKLPQPLN